MTLEEDILRAEKEIKREIKKLKLDFVLNEIEIPLIPIVKKMNKNGFLIDVKKLDKVSTEFKKKSSQLEEEIYQLAGEKFNIKSTQQLSKILFEKLKLPSKGLKKTPKGVISTKESELEKIRETNQIIDKILSFREFNKLISTYLDNIKKMISPDGRLRATFLQTGTSTGRMSSKEPNLQNIPTRTENGKKIRSFFVAEKRYSLVSFDYSQIELRVAAILSQDNRMLKIFEKNDDIHSAVAKDIFGEINKENRRKAKVINFGILYGMGVNSLKKNLGDDTTVAEAREYLNNYFEKYKGLAEFLEKTKNSVKEKGYSETLFGRKRFFPNINSKIPFLKAMAERMAINAPIQGTATGDIIKLAMIAVDKYLQDNKLNNQVKMLAQIHDELIFEIEQDSLKKIVPKIQEIMENILVNQKIDKKYKKIQLKTVVSIGNNWGEL